MSTTPAPDKLVFWRSSRSFWDRFFQPFLTLLGVLLPFFASKPDLFTFTLLCAWASVCLYLLFEGFSWRFVVIDDSGISWFFGRRRDKMLWSQVDACAYRNENGRRILRIFPRPGTNSFVSRDDARNLTPLKRILALHAKKFGLANSIDINFDNSIDIDFELADKPEQSLERAFQTCVKCIVAMRDPSQTGRSIRDFVETSPSLSVNMLNARAMKVIFLTGLAMFALFLIDIGLEKLW
jgi:hypothetical protein